MPFPTEHAARLRNKIATGKRKRTSPICFEVGAKDGFRNYINGARILGPDVAALADRFEREGRSRA